MFNIILLLVFVVLISLPVFFIITRKVFPRGSKRAAWLLSVLLTVLLVLSLSGLLLGVTL